MSWRVVFIALAAVVVIAALVWIVTSDGRWSAPSSDAIPARELPTPTPAPEQRITLFFAGFDGRLHPELRSVPLPEETTERIRVVTQQLLIGPLGDLRPIVPYPAEVNAVFVDAKGFAFVDVTAPPKPLTGSHTELLLVYGVVNSILVNSPELAGVQILFGGRELTTLTGHLDLSRPLALNKGFIAAS